MIKEIKDITYCIPYYDAPEMLQKHFDYWALYDAETLAKFKVVIADDGSPSYPALDVVKRNMIENLDIQVYRIKENKPWNVSGALNLAISKAPTEWVYSAAVDHVLPIGSIRGLIGKLLNDDWVYNPGRYRAFSKDNYFEYKPVNKPGNLFILTKELFWNLGGYNENFAGYYGGMGSLFKKIVDTYSKLVLLEDIFTIAFDQTIPDATVSDWGRVKSKYYYRNKPKLVRSYKTMEKGKDHLRFTYEKLI
jgi:hypothetical protein